MYVVVFSHIVCDDWLYDLYVLLFVWFMIYFFFLLWL